MAKKERYKQRSDGRYYARVNTGKYNDNGKPIMKYIYGKTSKEVEKKINDVKYEIEHGIYANDKGISFGEYAEKWLEVSKASKSLNTKEMYKRILKLHIDVLKYKKLSDITRSDIQLQINKCIEMPRTCELIKITVDQVMESAVDDGLITKNPCRNITLPVYKSEEKRPLTEIEKTALKNAVLTAEENAFINILYGAGLRPQELYALTINDIDFKRKEIHVNKALEFKGQTPSVKGTKTGNKRTVQVSSNTINIIKEFINFKSSIILFSNEEGQYMKRGAYYRLFERITKKMKETVVDSAICDNSFQGLTQYTFRHNYCTELYYSGISLKEAQRLMGHSDYSMIMKVYAHLDEKKEKTSEKIEKIGF